LLTLQCRIGSTVAQWIVSASENGKHDMRYQHLLTIAVVVALVSPAAAQKSEPDRLQRILDTGVVRVGSTMDTPVFSMRNASGQIEGFDMDVLDTLNDAPKKPSVGMD
jgi:ABC-type amino acid transport substrate-binding protein